MNELTDDDLALAQVAVSHAMNWWRDRPASDYKRRRMAEYAALNTKLNAILDAAGDPSTGGSRPMNDAERRRLGGIVGDIIRHSGATRRTRRPQPDRALVR